jgi:hypothetical protein
MLLREPVDETTMVPDSRVFNPITFYYDYFANLEKHYKYLWSVSHGPSYVNKAEEAELRAKLAAWRAKMIRTRTRNGHESHIPIFKAVKSDQTVFNGYGSQEACDMLYLAMITPAMPAQLICRSKHLWDRFVEALFRYQRERIQILNRGYLPSVSGEGAFRMNADAHRRFLSHVSCYKRKFCMLSKDELENFHSLSLLNPSYVIGNTGKAVGENPFNANYPN